MQDEIKTKEIPQDEEATQGHIPIARPDEIANAVIEKASNGLFATLKLGTSGGRPTGRQLLSLSQGEYGFFVTDIENSTAYFVNHEQSMEYFVLFSPNNQARMNAMDPNREWMEIQLRANGESCECFGCIE